MGAQRGTRVRRQQQEQPPPEPKERKSDRCKYCRQPFATTANPLIFQREQGLTLLQPRCKDAAECRICVDVVTLKKKEDCFEKKAYEEKCKTDEGLAEHMVFVNKWVGKKNATPNGKISPEDIGMGSKVTASWAAGERLSMQRWLEPLGKFTARVGRAPNQNEEVITRTFRGQMVTGVVHGEKFPGCFKLEEYDDSNVRRQDCLATSLTHSNEELDNVFDKTLAEVVPDAEEGRRAHAQQVDKTKRKQLEVDFPASLDGVPLFRRRRSLLPDSEAQPRS